MHLPRIALTFLVGAVLTGCALTGQAAAQFPQGVSVAEGIDPARSGFASDPALVAPLEVRWTQKVGAGISGVVYDSGMVIVRAGKQLVAFRADTGALAWQAGIDALGIPARGLTAANGVVLTVDADDQVRARSATTGAVLWTAPAEGGTPLAAGNRVFVPVDDDVDALDLRTGQKLWRATGEGATNPVTSDGGRVFASYACGWTFGWSAISGAELWRREGTCQGGSSSPSPALYRNQLWVPETGLVLNASTGQQIASYPRGIRPVFSGNVAMTSIPGRGYGPGPLIGTDIRTSKQVWKIGGLGTSATAVDTDFYALDEKARLHAGTAANGRRRQILQLGITPDPNDAGIPGLGFGKAPGLLLTSTGARLTALESVYRPVPTGIGAGSPLPDVVYGKRARIEGVTGTALRRAGARLNLSFDTAPYRRLRRSGKVRVQANGYFGFGLSPSRNTRLRVGLGASRSRTVSIYVYPAFASKTRRTGRDRNTIVTRLRVRGPRAVRLGGRTVVAYAGQPTARRYVRLGKARLRGAGRGRARATIRFRAIRSRSKRDTLLYCIPHISRAGLGRADVVDRRCGRARIPLR